MTPAAQSAIEDCYAALFEPVQWPRALQRLADAQGATSCVVRRSDFNVREMDLSAVDSSAHAAFTELWLQRVDGAPDPHCERAGPLRRRGHVVVVEHQISSDEERARMPYYREIAEHGDRPWWAQIGFQTARHSWYLPLYRNAAAGPFDTAEAQALARLAPPLSRLFEVAETVAEAAVIDGLRSFDLIGRAVVLIDWKGRARYLNDSARHLVEQGLTLTRGRLGARDRPSCARLRALIRDLVRRRPDVTRALPPVVVCRDGAPWLAVEAAPVTSTVADVFASGHSLLILTDLTDRRLPGETALRAVFGLTLAEARLARAVAGGDGLAAAAAALGIGIETARSQLRAVFAKTGTRRQAQLAALLGRLPANRH